MLIKKIILLILLLILVFSLTLCNIPGLNINTADDETITLSGYVDISNFFSSGNTFKTYVQENNLSKWKIAVKNTSTFVEETISPDYNSGSKKFNFSTELKKLPGSSLQLYAYYDSNNNLVYDSPAEKVCTLTIISGDKNNKSIRIDDIFAYTGTISPDSNTTAAWGANTRLTSKIYNTTHYLTHYQLLTTSKQYTYYIAKNNTVNIEVGPKNDNFSKQAAQIYSGEFVYEDVTGSSYSINRVTVTIDIDDDETNPVFRGYPLYFMMGESDWKVQIIPVSSSITLNSYSFYVYRRSTDTLYGWVFIDKNFNGVHQKDEPVNPAITDEGEYIKSNNNNSNTSDINEIISPCYFTISS